MSNDKWLKETLDKIENKVDKLDGRLDNVDVTLAKQEVCLAEHVKRTNIAEQNIHLIRSEMKPIQKHVDQVHAVLKIIGLIATIIAMISGILKIIEFFKIFS